MQSTLYICLMILLLNHFVYQYIARIKSSYSNMMDV